MHTLPGWWLEFDLSCSEQQHKNMWIFRFGIKHWIIFRSKPVTLANLKGNSDIAEHLRIMEAKWHKIVL